MSLSDTFLDAVDEVDSYLAEDEWPEEWVDRVTRLRNEMQALAGDLLRSKLPQDGWIMLQPNPR